MHKAGLKYDFSETAMVDYLIHGVYDSGKAW